MKFDRGIIKWQPFESLTSSKQIINSLLKEKSKITKPIISEEETTIIEENILEAFYSNINITIFFYKDGFIKKITSKIIKIDQVYKLIYLNNNLKLFFNQIIKVTL